jgi:hypothetical protein
VIEQGHDSPEQAAMVGFPAAHCRVIASQSFEDDAYVLLDTGSPGQPYLYGANCYRKDGKWFESGSSDASGWAQTSHDPDLGTLSFWGDAPASVDSVRVEFGNTLVDAPIHQGAYFLVWWRVPNPSEWPDIVAIREDGTWRPESDVGLQLRVAMERGRVGNDTA